MPLLLRRTSSSCRTLSSTVFYMTIILVGLRRFNAVDGLKITQIRMPEPMENGTVDAVIVDCDYTYTEGEMKGFVLKWFLNESEDPVYQWIPPKAPEVIGVLTTKVDLSFRMTNDNFTMHRALRILNPTVEIAGTYKCQVSSMKGGDSNKAKDLVVYVPAATMSINYTKPTQHTVNVTCLVTGVFPCPDAFILVHRGPNEEPEKVTDPIVSVKSYMNGDGSYDTIMYREFQDKRLSPKTSFECVFAIPAAKYNASDRITYYPGLPASTTTPGSTPVHLKDNISTEFSHIDLQSITAVGHTTVAWSSSVTGLVVIMSFIISRFQVLHFS